MQTPGGNAAIGNVARQPSRNTWGSWSTSTFTDRAVTPESASGISAWHAATSLISWGVGTLPLRTRDWSSGHPVEVVGGRVAPMLRESPNDDMPAQVFHPLMLNHLLHRGNAYYTKEYRGNDPMPAALHPIHPDRVAPFRDANGVKWFRVWNPTDGTFETFSKRYIGHIIGHPGEEGLMGVSIVSQMRERLGVAQSASEFQQRFYSNGTVAGGVLKAPPGVMSMPDEAKHKLAKSWQGAHAGGRNAHGVVVLEGGWDYQPIGLSHADQQFIEQLQNAVSEIASWFHIPAAMLNGSQSGEPYNNAETHDLRVTKWAMQPWARWYEAALNNDINLYGPTSPWRPEFDFDALYRTDAKTRAEIADIRIKNSSMSPDEARVREGDAPRGDEYGSQYTDQLAANGISRQGTSVAAKPAPVVGAVP